MEDRTRMQKNLANLMEKDKQRGPGSAFQNPICKEDKESSYCPGVWMAGKYTGVDKSRICIFAKTCI